MRTVNRLAIATISIFLVLATPLNVFASGQLADADDIFYTTAPSPNTKLAGNVTVAWRVYDDDQPSVPFEINLRDAVSCQTHVGTIAAGLATSSKVKDAQVSFNSAGPLIDISNVPDGNYCLQICHSFANNGNPYSSCNLRIITIRNNNSSPKITSSPPADKTIGKNESWSYNANATDTDGDPLSFSLLSSPNFLKIEEASGLITSNSNQKNPGEYTVRLQVQDNYGGKDTQSFTLVVQGDAIETPEKNEPADINILFPSAQSQFTGKGNQFIWNANDPEGIKSVKLFYSSDGRTWMQIAEVDPKDNVYDWDVSKLQNGDYQVQVSVEDQDGVVTSQSSDAFKIFNPDVKSEQTFSSIPLIVNIKPAEGAEINETNPTFYGEFTPPVNGTIDPASFRFFIDSTDRIEACEVTTKVFSCTPDEILSSGIHKVRVEIRSGEGQTAIKEWTFNILEAGGPPIIIPEEAISPGVGLVALILCLVILLIAIPVVIYTIWRNRKEGRTINIQTPTINIPTPSLPTISLPTIDLGSRSVEPDPITPPQPEIDMPDPTAFENYDEYLEAVSSLPEINVNYVPSDQLTSEIMTPSYVDIEVEPDPVDTAEAAYAPDWLKTVTEPDVNYGAPESPQEPAVPEPTFTAEEVQPESENENDEFGYGK